MECGDGEAGDGLNDREDGWKYDAENDPVIIRLGEYHADDLLTKHGMTVIFNCNLRTVQRMVDRYELPPAVQFAGRSFWIVGRLKTWMANVAELREAEALKQAKRLNVFRT
jgi:hypothetical protein